MRCTARLIARALLLALAGISTAAPARACVDFAQAPSTRWRTERAENGAWWLVTPCGDRFFSIGLNVIDGDAAHRDGPNAYRWSSFYPTHDAWGDSIRQRLRGWGFNPAGAWSEPPSVLDLPA